jgi:hypothetical protein
VSDPVMLNVEEALHLRKVLSDFDLMTCELACVSPLGPWSTWAFASRLVRWVSGPDESEPFVCRHDGHWAPHVCAATSNSAFDATRCALLDTISVLTTAVALWSTHRYRNGSDNIGGAARAPFTT